MSFAVMEWNTLKYGEYYYDPVAESQDKSDTAEKPKSSWLKYMSSHPSTQERIERIQALSKIQQQKNSEKE